MHRLKGLGPLQTQVLLLPLLVAQGRRRLHPPPRPPVASSRAGFPGRAARMALRFERGAQDRKLVASGTLAYGAYGAFGVLEQFVTGIRQDRVELLEMHVSFALLRSGARRIDRSTVSSNSSGKAVAAVLGTLLVGLTGYAGVYLPYYSEGALEARERAMSSAMSKARQKAEESLKPERAPGSVWKNIAIKREGASGEEGSSGWPSISREP